LSPAVVVREEIIRALDVAEQTVPSDYGTEELDEA
jgi:hypothetical protein